MTAPRAMMTIFGHSRSLDGSSSPRGSAVRPPAPQTAPPSKFPVATERNTVVHVFLLGGILAAAVFAQGGMIPEIWLGCELAIGLLVTTWAVSEKVTTGVARSTRVFPKAILALPLYAVCQTIPLPLYVVEALSPSRVALQQAVSVLAPDAAGWTAISAHPDQTVTLALRLAAYGGVFWIARGATFRLGKYAFAIAAPIIVIAALQAAIVLHVGEGQRGEEHGGAGQASAGSYVNRNHLAGLLEMALPFAAVAFGVFIWPVGRLRRRGLSAVGAAVSGAFALVIVAGLLATRSRAGLVAALASLFVLGLIAAARAARPQRLAGAIVLPLLLGAAFIYLPSDNLVRRYGALVGATNLHREGRVALWRETVDLIAAYPLVGCGFGAYESVFLSYKRSAPMVNDAHAHNDYLELQAEAGLIGFAICVMLAGRLILGALRASLGNNPRRQMALAAACMGSLTAILVHSFVDFNLRIPANGMVLFWVLGVSAACGDSAVKRSEDTAETSS